MDGGPLMKNPKNRCRPREERKKSSEKKRKQCNNYVLTIEHKFTKDKTSEIVIIT